MQNIVTLGQINDDLKFTSVTAAQLAEMGFAALDNKPICEALPPEESRRLRNAKLYQADSIAQIRVALAKRLAAPASCLLQIQEPSEESQEAWRAGIHAGRDQVLQSAPAAVAVDERWCPDVCPISGRKFFMWVTHHDTGADVPTYGGPFDSYTIPVKDEDGSYSCERYDHDFGGWREWEDIGLTIVDDQSFVVEPDNPRYDEIRDFAEGRAALAATPAADIGNPITETVVPVVLPEPDDSVKEVMGMATEFALLQAEAREALNELGECDEAAAAYASAKESRDALESKLRALLAGVSTPAAQAVEVDDQMALAFHHAITDGSIGQDDLNEIKIGLRAVLVNVQAPQVQADARDADDAGLIEWLSGQYLAADFHWGDPKTPVLVIEIPPTASVCGDFRTDVRAAIAAAKGE